MAGKLRYLFISLFFLSAIIAQETSQKKVYGLVVHGGAGTLTKGAFTAEEEKAYEDKLSEAIDSGYKILESGGKAIDAVQAVIIILEDSPLFNAGKGAVFTSKGTNELDAAIMDGHTLNAGTIARVTRVKNPIILARKVMEVSPHVMLVGDGAEEFAKEVDVELVNPEYFRTEKRWESLQKAQEKENLKSEVGITPLTYDLKFGTVGCVALDKEGDLVAGTSTGGMTNKKYGRVGDVPIIGAGTYANNSSCAISATGWGEYFIRLTVAKDISALMEYKNMSIEDASNTVIHEKLQNLGGSGGVIGIDKSGNITMTFNTSGMFRGYKTSDKEKFLAIYGE